LEERFSETAETQPELLAHHYTEADLNEKAVVYWHQAGQRAIARSAHQEAINHLRKGLAVLTTLPDTPERVQHELRLHVALGTPLMATQGFAASEVRQVYARARELCQRMGDTPQSFPVLRGLWRSYQARGDLRTARELAEHCLDLAQHTQDPDHLVEACEVAGITFYHLGDLVTARPHFEHGIALYDAQRHHALTALYGEDPGVACLSRVAHILWMLGYPEQALQRNAEALTLACDLSHPFSVGYALTFAVQLYHYRREWQMVQEQSEAAIALSTEHGFPIWLTHNQVLLGWTLVAQGHHERGMAQGLEGMTAYRALGTGANLPNYLTRMAEAYGMVGQLDAGLAMLNEALSVAEETEVRYYEPEIHRLKGELLLQQSPTHQTEAEACYQNALEVSRHQQAKSLELRAATSLARLWQSQGKRDEARELLEPVYSWFTEGFDTADLIDAKTLLDELS
jgi:predicted ATPase